MKIALVLNTGAGTLRGGDPGALPAIFGLVVLVIVFSNLTKQPGWKDPVPTWC